MFVSIIVHFLGVPFESFFFLGYDLLASGEFLASRSAMFLFMAPVRLQLSTHSTVAQCSVHFSFSRWAWWPRSWKSTHVCRALGDTRCLHLRRSPVSFANGKFPFLFFHHMKSNSVEFGDQVSGDKIAIHLQLPQEKKKNVRFAVAFHTF